MLLLMTMMMMMILMLLLLLALSVGSTLLPNGAFIGIPRTALGVFTEDFQRNLMISKKPIDPNDEKTNLLLRILETDDEVLYR